MLAQNNDIKDLHTVNFHLKAASKKHFSALLYQLSNQSKKYHYTLVYRYTLNVG
jgi:hypothetical protein